MDYYIKQSKLSDSFCCISDKCPSTCCSGWSVIWTSEEIAKLKKHCNGDLIKRYNSAFPEEKKYNAIKMDKDDLCPFLTDGLCEIHRQLGEGFLSYTCRCYPRIIRLIGNEFIKSCKTTCYAVVDRLLSEEDSMELVIKKVDGDIISAVVTPDASIEKMYIADKLEEILWDDSITIKEALIRSAGLVNVSKNGQISELNNVFSNIFGWDLILDNDSTEVTNNRFEKICSDSVRNIIKSLFMEWRISGWSDELSEEENVFVFVFNAAVMIEVYYGALVFASSRDELICSINDIAGTLFSNVGISSIVGKYLSENQFINIQFISNILK